MARYTTTSTTQPKTTPPTTIASVAKSLGGGGWRVSGLSASASACAESVGLPADLIDLVELFDDRLHVN